jgi:hypothetical protein
MHEAQETLPYNQGLSPVSKPQLTAQMMCAKWQSLETVAYLVNCRLSSRLKRENFVQVLLHKRLTPHTRPMSLTEIRNILYPLQ